MVSPDFQRLPTRGGHAASRPYGISACGGATCRCCNVRVLRAGTRQRAPTRDNGIRVLFRCGRSTSHPGARHGLRPQSSGRGTLPRARTSSCLRVTADASLATPERGHALWRCAPRARRRGRDCAQGRWRGCRIPTWNEYGVPPDLGRARGSVPLPDLAIGRGAIV